MAENLARPDSSPDMLRPGRLWSQLDMAVNFSFYQTSHLLREISILVRTSHHNKEYLSELSSGYERYQAIHDPKGIEALADCIKTIKSLVPLCRDAFSGLNSSHVNAAISRLAHLSEQENPNWAGMNERVRALRDALEIELREHFYYQYPKALGQKFAAWQLDWESTRKAFPSTEIDIFCATDCYALGHNTASVFHCMRILENGLKALASEVGRTFDIQQWYTILNDIEAAIGEMRKHGIPGLDKAVKDARLQFLSEAAKEFFYFKDGWRNYVSHNRAHYDAHQALGTLEHVRSFMTHLSKQLAEKQP